MAAGNIQAQPGNSYSRDQVGIPVARAWWNILLLTGDFLHIQNIPIIEAGPHLQSTVSPQSPPGFPELDGNDTIRLGHTRRTHSELTDRRKQKLGDFGVSGLVARRLSTLCRGEHSPSHPSNSLHLGPTVHLLQFPSPVLGTSTALEILTTTTSPLTDSGAHETDILNAFNGVSEIFAALQNDAFLWGLAESPVHAR